MYVGKQNLAKIVNNNRFAGGQNFQNSEKSEDEKRASDTEKNYNRTSRKSLPHKKRISRKLKKQTPSAVTKIQCSLCEQTFNSGEDFAQHELLCQTTITPVNTSSFSCQLCNAAFHDQLRFFEHLKAHYEPNQAAEQVRKCFTTF